MGDIDITIRQYTLLPVSKIGQPGKRRGLDEGLARHLLTGNQPYLKRRDCGPPPGRRETDWGKAPARGA
ncbi:hypothetical protein Amme_090_003 [Acidomonas methanolica NBRC 104435]|uniref:Uncharacterized protein n=1 Tax=Acidomonas methanolica NBRC 104435 TaxID=1231351 RepID=A0A023D8B1_ACIMT|nr:hypothetical protein Amme_090_003 [Acidomonas methanolica NBRC 104435]GEL00576.1 hypothetical protein AME01nite_30740 [Acidomonas methanolica NBRC 104435]